MLDRIIDNSAISTVSTEVEIFVRKQTAILLFGSVLARGRYQNPILSKLPLYTNRLAVGTVGCGETIMCGCGEPLALPTSCMMMLMYCL